MCDAEDEDRGVPRRTFTGRLAVAVGGALTAAISAGPVGMLLHPLISRTDKVQGAWKPVGSVGSFKVGSPPRRVILTEDRQDAWLRQPGVPVGSVLVERRDEATFRVFSAVCPHLGCAVDYKPGKGCFLCPCHTSFFSTDGDVLAGSDGRPAPSPRGLDPLEWRVDGEELQVHWVTYKAGVADRVVVS